MEDQRFLTGQGRYVADQRQPGEAHLAVLRSPHAHARLLGIDTTAAAAMPGVLGVFTAADLAGLGPIPCTTAVPTEGPMHVPPHHALASGRVRYAGQPVAFAVAETAVQAADALEQVAAEYQPLPAVTEAAGALAPGAPLLWEDVPGNLAFTFRKGDATATARAMAAAAAVVALTLVNNRVIVAPLEHRGCLAQFDPAAHTFLLLLSGQGVHGIRRDLAEAVFHVPLAAMQVASPDVGGGFGVKNGLYPEYILALWAARALGRPVRWQSGHGEDFLSTIHARDNLTEARLALDAAGTFLGLEIDTVANMGFAMATGGPGSSTNSPWRAVGAGYAIPAIAMTVRGAFTNTVPIDAYRGAGKPEMNYLLERLVDEAARITGHDRVALRRRNLVQHFPHLTAAGTTIADGRFAANIDAALQAADTAGFPARRAASPLPRGLGITCFLETARGAAGEGAEVRFLPGGRVSIHLGTQSNGQGHETSFPQIAADWLHVPIDCIDYLQADTRTVRDGQGHGGARSLHMGGTALVGAMEAALAKAAPVAARLLQAAEVSWQGGRFVAGERSITLREVAREEPGLLDSYHWTEEDRITFPNGCHVAEVEVDPETGEIHLLRYTAVDDFGTAVNPLLLEGQVQGGLAQGIGQALTERCVYDGAGQLLTGSFMDYALPRAADLPDFDLHFQGTPTAANPLGAKGAGQAGAIAAPPALVAAVLDALRPLGVLHLDMPLTPERVWQAIQATKR